jgi:hypothetical protein
MSGVRDRVRRVDAGISRHRVAHARGKVGPLNHYYYPRRDGYDPRQAEKDALFKKPPVTKPDKGVPVEELRRRIYEAGERAKNR